MKRRLVSTVSVVAAAVAVLLVGSVARAQKSSISMKFVPCPTNCLMCPPMPGDPCYNQWYTNTLLAAQQAGVDARNWNNLSDSFGSLTPLVRDDNGEATTVAGAAVTWSAAILSANPVEVLSFIESDVIGDQKLMTYYLDQNTWHPALTPTSITITGIPDDFVANGYHVVVYTLTNQLNETGGMYVLNKGQQTKFVRTGGNAFFGGPDFVEAIGDDPAFGRNDWGNYITFTGLTGNLVTIDAMNNVRGKAPVNGIQIVKGPVP